MIEGDRVEGMNILNREVAECPLCDLARTRTRAVPGEGNLDADIMFVGEGPGFNEDVQGRPFVGRAGKFLDELIQSIDLRRESVYITNVVKCRPPNNRDPLPPELGACRPYLMRQIELVNPKVVVTLGRYSLGTFFPGEVISRIHGSLRKRDDRHYFAMYHPAAALYQERYRKLILEDMQKLGDWLSSLKPVSVKVDVEEVELKDAKPGTDTSQQLSLFPTDFT